MLEKRTATIRLAEQIRNYIRDRAKVEGVGFELSLPFFIQAVIMCDLMFGVEHDGEKMVRDYQEPYPGYFQEWLERKGLPEVSEPR